MTEYLIENWNNRDALTAEPTRDGFGRGLVSAGESDPRVMVLTGDLKESTRVDGFATQSPERFIECGVAEQNMMGIAAGLALSGKVPFISSYAVFNPGRNWDQLRVSVCVSKANVKVVGAHAGLSVGPDGATHQALEDIAITRVLPNLAVVIPADGKQAEAATLAVAAWEGPCYLRLSRAKSPVFIRDNAPFSIGEAQVLREGTDLTLIASGPLVYEALMAAEIVKESLSIEVINLHTVKPLDTKTILQSAKKTGWVLTLEEHQRMGGMGSAVVEFLSEVHSVPVLRLGVDDTFGESGEPFELWQKHGLDAKSVAERVKGLLGK